MTSAVENDPAKTTAEPVARAAATPDQPPAAAPSPAVEYVAPAEPSRPAEQPSVRAPAKTAASPSEPGDKPAIARDHSLVKSDEPERTNAAKAADARRAPAAPAPMRAAGAPEEDGASPKPATAAYEHMRGTAVGIGMTCLEASRSVAGMQARMVLAAGENTLMAFDLARDLAKVRSLSDAVDVQANYLRRQFDTFSTQANDMRALSTRLVQDVTQAPGRARDRF